MSTLYSVDTSVIVFMNREIPKDIHVGLWGALEGLIQGGVMVMSREAYEELLVVGDGCGPWAKAFDGFVQDAGDDELAVVAQIGALHPDWVTPTQNAADPWVIAAARTRGGTVVTQERPKGPNAADANLKIPNVCSELGVPCLNLNELARAEGWTF